MPDLPRRLNLTVLADLKAYSRDWVPVALALRVAFDDLQLRRVDAFAREDNIGSCRVLEKNGFRRVGMSCGHVHIDGRWRDDVFFQKLAPWPARQLTTTARASPPPRRPGAGPR